MTDHQTSISAQDTLNKTLMTEIATLGGGCFWCIEAVLQDLKGVVKVESGYSGGTVVNPSYREVCTGATGHAEVVQVTFEPSVISYHDLLEIFFAFHDPTTLNRQGNDVGTQYRSGIYCYDAKQKAAAEKSRNEYQKALTQNGHGTITTEIIDAPTLYYAEEYHQQYLSKNPDGYCGLGGTGVSCPIGLGV